MVFEERLEVAEIAGLALQVVLLMGKAYKAANQADPVLYGGLKAIGELADQYRERAEEAGVDEIQLDQITEVANSIHLTAMSVGEQVRKVIEENGLPIELMTESLFESSVIERLDLDNDDKQD